MNSILIIILLILMILIGGKRGFKAFISLFINFLTLIIIFYLIAIGFNPFVVTIIGCLIISATILFYVNKVNIKTICSYLSVFIVLIILIAFIYLFTYLTQIGGFSEEAYEEINMFSYDININMTNIMNCVIILGLIGATVDTSIAISSALYEVYLNNKHLSTRELYKSGLNIGKDILCTTTNTLLFAYLGESMTLIIWFQTLKYTSLNIINAKVLASEFLKIMASSIGCILVIPLTSYIMTKIIKRSIENKV